MLFTACQAYIASMCQSSDINTQSQNGTYKFEIRVLLKDYWKEDYKVDTAVRNICEVEGEGVISEGVAQRWFQLFNTGKENTKDLPRSGRSKLCGIEIIRRVLEENIQKSTRMLSEGFMRQKIPYIARLRALENHTEAVDLYLMN